MKTVVKYSHTMAPKCASNILSFTPLVNSGSYISKGDKIITLTSKSCGETLNSVVVSPSNGYICFSNNLSHLLEGYELCAIYTEYEEYLSQGFRTKYHVIEDPFSKEKSIIWDMVGGDNHSKGFVIDAGIIDNKWILEFSLFGNAPCLKFCYNSKFNSILLSDRLLFLFEDQTQLAYSLDCVRRKEGYCRDVIIISHISLSDLQVFMHKPLSLIRVDRSGDRLPLTRDICYKEHDDVYRRWTQSVLMHYAAVFEDFLKQNGIETYSAPQQASVPISASLDQKEEKCYVYLMADTSNGYKKIGISNNPRYREHTLQSEKPTIELMAAKSFPSRAIAEAIESSLHKVYATKRIRGEWFDLSPSDVAQIKETLEQ